MENITTVCWAAKVSLWHIQCCIVYISDTHLAHICTLRPNVLPGVLEPSDGRVWK